MVGRVLQTLHFLSVDIALGVAGSMVLISAAANSVLPWQWYPLVACSTWLVYLVDRLLDAARFHGHYPTIRHTFIHAHRHAVVACIAMLAGTCVALLPYVSIRQSWPVAILAIAAISIHRWLQHTGTWRWAGLAKDIHVVLVYTAGTASIPLLYGTWSASAVAAIGTVFCLAMAIVAVESTADITIDQGLAQPSLARTIGITNCARLSIGCGCLACIGSLLLPPIVLVQGLCAILLPALFTTHLGLPKQRLVAELVLAMPLIMLLV
jgi:hypothetical protein